MLSVVCRCLTIGLLALAAAGCDLEPGKVSSIIAAPDARRKLVETTDGPVVGMAAPQGQAFLGIPYAAPPVGALRWRAPQPPARWTEPRPAVELGDSCLQNLSLDAQTGQKGSGPVIGSEDCLTLNVYAPAAATAGDRRPVMVWIYGGAFLLGSGGQYDPSRLAETTGSLVVSFNYRHGALGFLAHPELRGQHGDGAFALLDQQAALRWVGANIAAFGGDPHNVTLFGQSAGAWSVCDQLAAPGAARLFARAIIESGSCTTPETSLPAEEAEAGGQRLAADLGCTGDDAIACLRDKPAPDLMEALPERRGVTGSNSWSPAFGLDVLPLAPRRAFETNRFNHMPVIDGTTRDEGRLFSYLRAYKGDLWTAADYARAVEQIFGPDTPAILAQYPAERFDAPGLAYAAVLTDGLFACPAMTLDRLLARQVPVYAYEFGDAEAPFSLPRLPWMAPLEAYHTAEIAYVFGRPWILADSGEFTSSQVRLSAAIQTYWGRFAQSGDPNGSDTGTWPRFDKQAAILTFSPDAIGRNRDFTDRHRCAFWTTLHH